MELKLKVISAGGQSGQKIITRCPVCRKKGIFEEFSNINDLAIGKPTPALVGQRRCPDPECYTHIFFVRVGDELSTYPAERIDFDATNIPTSIVNALEDAITCHSIQCYVASAIMVRKALEELCLERGATGSNLKDRIKSLGSKVILPTELFDGLDDLRLLGNDAAHIESQVYANVGGEEVGVAIELTKEVLKAVYQYASLLGRLRNLKK